MRGHPLLASFELELHRTANTLLWLMLIYRLAGYFWWGPGLWLFDSIFGAICILLALLNLSATYLPRFASQPLAYLLSLLTFASVLTMIPRRYWWPFKLHWIWWAVFAALALAALVLRAMQRRRWQIQIGGHGHDWIRRWADGKPLEARALAAGSLLLLNYDGELASLRD